MTIYDDAVEAGKNASRAVVEAALASREAAAATEKSRADALSLEVTDFKNKLADAVASSNTLSNNLKTATETIKALTAKVDALNAEIEKLKSGTQNPDPTPTPTSKTLFGACPENPGGTTYAAAMTVVNKWGAKTPVRQFYGDTTTWAGTPAGSPVHRSYKIAATRTDAEIDSLLKAADADAAKNKVIHIITFWHESDNDGLDAAGRAARIKTINRAYERKQALGLKNILISVIFTGGFFADYTTQAKRDLWDGVKGDLAGLDADGVHTTAADATDYRTEYDDEVAGVKKFVEDNKAFGFIGWTVPEFATGKNATFDPDGTKLAKWITKWANYFEAQGAVHVLYYDYKMSKDNRLPVGSPEYKAWQAQVAKNA